jgi:hypothetical protein
MGGRIGSASRNKLNNKQQGRPPTVCVSELDTAAGRIGSAGVPLQTQ